MLTNKLTGAGAADKTYIEDVFSTYLYTGNGSTQTINNGIDLAGKGGMVWIKSRTSYSGSSFSHSLQDTLRGITKVLLTDSAIQELTYTERLTAFNSTGFNVGGNIGVNNGYPENYASWTFRKAPKFFDVVTYTGNGGGDRYINHSLGQAPGMIIIKRTDSTSNWIVWHRGVANGDTGWDGKLNLTDAFIQSGNLSWNGWQPTSTQFPVSSQAGTTSSNVSGATYVAYLFAHDTSTDGLIQCGSFNSNGLVNLGWEPQYVMIKRADAAEDWYVMDSMRGFTTSSYTHLRPNSSVAEGTGGSAITIDSQGFNISFSPAGPYIYMAIRRGPMKTPTDATKVFKPTFGTATGTYPYSFDTGFPVDMGIVGYRPGATGFPYNGARLLGAKKLVTNTTAAEVAESDWKFDYQTGFFPSGAWTNSNGIAWCFRRAPGFFDVVCFNQTTSTDQRVSHSLNSTPELIILKSRVNSNGWFIWHKLLPINAYLQLNTTAFSAITSLNFWGQSLPTTTTFGLNHDQYGTDGQALVAYLFASCPGVSKVGSFTGNGSSQTINCGFSAGARFVLIKRTDSTGNWYVWDTARGIVAGNEPHLSLNSTAAEVTTNDTIDPDSTGFIVNQVAATNVNVSGGSYIYLAIA